MRVLKKKRDRKDTEAADDRTGIDMECEVEIRVGYLLKGMDKNSRKRCEIEMGKSNKISTFPTTSTVWSAAKHLFPSNE